YRGYPGPTCAEANCPLPQRSRGPRSGGVAVSYKGEFIPGAPYKFGDIVLRDNAYVYLSRIGWKPLSRLRPDPADRGEPGRDGADGEPGPAGVPGVPGQGFNWRGEYKHQQYHPFDCVVHEGSS